jgi:hypothetical protein
MISAFRLTNNPGLDRRHTTLNGRLVSIKRRGMVIEMNDKRWLDAA